MVTKALKKGIDNFLCVLLLHFEQQLEGKSIWEGGGGAREPSPMAAEMSGRLSEKIETLKRSLYYVV